MLWWSATPTNSSQLPTVQVRLPKLHYSFVELTVAGIELETLRFHGERSTDYGYSTAT